MWQVWTKKDGLIREYPLKLQAYIWCWLNGYVVNAGRYGYWLVDNVKVVRK